MRGSRVAWLAASIELLTVVLGQQSGWQPNQVNSTMCSWKGSRAGVIRDTVYIDGGYLYWTPGMADGSYGTVIEDNNPLGLMYLLNFSRPFNTSSNMSDVGTWISKVGNGAANNIAPNYYDGAMLVNNDELFLYGGLLNQTDNNSPPGANSVLSDELFQYGSSKGNWYPGWLQDTLPEGMSRYITYGGAASAPSENKAWYFGGQRSADWGPIYYPSANSSLNPTNVSNTFITLDMTTQQGEIWTNVTLPNNIQSRANPELVWVPVGPQGILLAIGGVTFPAYDNPQGESQNAAQSKQDSPGFMTTIDIYDVASGNWYQQNAPGGPSQLAQGCAVVACAQDYSSFNIYWYGGFDGLDMTDDFNDDVWILSLPSFMWMKVVSGKASHGRAGHTCVKPYPDQMFVIGGYTAQKEATPTCVEDNIVLNFNLSSVEWMDSYDPANWGDYRVPEMIYMMIGGGETGGATLTAPSPTGWSTPDLASVFATPYPTSKLTHYYPYVSEPSNPKSGSGVPSWLAPVLGVVLGLVLLTAIVIAILLYRRRKLLRKNGKTDENGNRILSWIRGQDGAAKDSTVTTEDSHNASDDMEHKAGGVNGQPEMAAIQHHEMPNTPLVELMDTSPRAELSDTAMTPTDIMTKRSRYGSSANTPTTPYSTRFGADHASLRSNATSQHYGGLQIARPDSPALGGGYGAAPDVPPLPTTPATPWQHQLESQQQHQQQPGGEQISVPARRLSNASARSRAGSARGSPASVRAAPFSAVTEGPHSPPLPVSPPTGDEREAADYMSAGSGQRRNLMTPIRSRSARSPLTKSVFIERKEDLED